MTPTSDQQPDPLRLALSNLHKHDSLMAKLENRKLANALVAVTKNLPRGRVGLAMEWHLNNVARNEVAPRGQDLRDDLRDVLRMSVASGDAAIVAQTLIQITAYLFEILEQVKAVLPQADAQPLTVSLVDGLREVSEAVAAIGVAGTTRNETDLVLAIKEGDEAVQSLDEFRASAMAHLHQPYRRATART